jgi:hypothetical protein
VQRSEGGEMPSTRMQKLTWLEPGWGQTLRKLPSLCERRMCHSICDCSATDVYWMLFGVRSGARNRRSERTFGGGMQEAWMYTKFNAVSLVYFVSRKHTNSVISIILCVFNIYIPVFILKSMLGYILCSVNTPLSQISPLTVRTIDTSVRMNQILRKVLQRNILM